MRVGDKVKLIGIPPGLKDDEEFRTRSLFERCRGETFVVSGLEAVEGLPHQLVQLDVGHVVGRASYLETIWIEPEYLEVVD